jgi:hypothetical protein
MYVGFEMSVLFIIQGLTCDLLCKSSIGFLTLKITDAYVLEGFLSVFL